MKEYKFKSEDVIEICAECPCLQYNIDLINEITMRFPKCGINDMPLQDTEERNFHCPLVEVK
jgi:hypothetical protein